MFPRAKKASALIVMALLVVAAFYVESRVGRKCFSSRSFRSVSFRASERSGGTAGERSTLKRGWYVEDEIPADPVRAETRNLSPSGGRGEVVPEKFSSVSLPRLILAPKISSNLFLSVLNL